MGGVLRVETPTTKYAIVRGQRVDLSEVDYLSYGFQNGLRLGYLDDLGSTTTLGTTDAIQLNTSASTPEHSPGLLFWDTDRMTVGIYKEIEDVTLQVGQESWIIVSNQTGSTIPNGSAVYINGASGGFPTIALARADLNSTSFSIGLTTHSIATGETGFVTTSGVVNDIDTSGFSDGAQVFLSDSTAGAIESTKGVIAVELGYVLFSNATTGRVFIAARWADYYTKSQVDNIINNIETGNIGSENLLVVSRGAGGEGYQLFDTVEDAIDYVNSLIGGPDAASDSNRYVISVTPGVYPENNPLTIPSYVAIQGTNDEVSVVQALNNNDPLFEASDETQMYTIRLDGPTNNSAVLVDAGAESEFVRLAFKNCLTGVEVDGVGTSIFLEESKFKDTVTTAVLATDSGQISASNVFSQATTTAYYANGGQILLHNSFASGAINALYSNNAGGITAHLVTVNDCTNVARANNSSTITGSSVNSGGSVGSTWDVLQEDASHIDLTFGIMSASKISRFDASVTHLIFQSEDEENEGLALYGELQVGSPELGRESVFGEGSSYTRGMLVYTETALGAFTNVSTDAASSSGSTFTFPAVAADNAIYVSSDLQDAADYKHQHGIKMTITTALDPGAGEIVSEYWDGVVGGGSWVEFNTLSTLVDAPHTEYANAFFERANVSENIRFDDLEDATRFDWAKNDPPTTGTSRFWMRFRVKTGVTTVPVFEQFKLHVDRTKIGDDGFIEYMGDARQLRKIENVNLGNIWEVDGFAPKDNNTDFGAIINLKLKKNKFENGKIDGFGQAFAVPEGLDTSRPLTFIIRWAPSTDVAAGDVALDFVYGQAQLGTVLDGTNTENISTDITTTTLNTANLIYATTFTFSIPTSLATSGVFMVLKRDAVAGATGDTYAGNIYVVNIEMDGYFWH